MQEIQLISKRIYTRLQSKVSPEENHIAVDPVTMIIIIQIVTLLIRTLQNCKNGASLKSTFTDPTRVDKFILKRIIRKELGWFKNLLEGKHYYNSILEESSREVTIKEIEYLIRNVK